MFDHKFYINHFLDNASAGYAPINDAMPYDVKIEPGVVELGSTYWRVIGVHHLAPKENVGGHNIYLTVLDEQGIVLTPIYWVGWTWEGKLANEMANPVALDKPAYEPAGNIAMWWSQTISVWVNGLLRNGTDLSDKVTNLHTRHADEKAEGGQLWNTLGHHSYYVVFQRTVKVDGISEEEPDEEEPDIPPTETGPDYVLIDLTVDPPVMTYGCKSDILVALGED